MSTTKTILLGKSTTGKTSIFRRLIYNEFFSYNETTLGICYMRYKNDNKTFDIYDTCGQERFFSILPIYFRNVKLILFVFDVSKLDTLDIFNTYIPMINTCENYKIIIIGNKIDLINAIDIPKIQDYVLDKLSNTIVSKNIFGYVYISTMTNDNYDELANMICKCNFNDDQKLLTKINIDDKIVKDNNNKCYC